VIFGIYDLEEKDKRFFALCFIDNMECHIVPLPELPYSGKEYHKPVLLAVDNKVVLIIDEKILWVYDDYKIPPKIIFIKNTELIDSLMDKFGNKIRLHGFPSQNIENDCLYPIIFAEPVNSLNARTYIWIIIDLKNGSANWEKFSNWIIKNFHKMIM